MKLKLLREQTGESWTLKPNRECIIGRSQDCDIVLADAVSVGDRHLKLSFDPTANAWYACDLGSGNGTYINSQRITNCALAAQTRIGLAGNIFLVATPDGLAPAAPPPSLYTPPSQSYNSPSPTRFPTTGGAYRDTPQKTASSLRVLGWSEYVEKQACKSDYWLSRA
ncbi:MAG: FHA domain-containing protein, partial [Cyanobacteriota bacterium]|nr:FHA domain-containing protein [Cyanobacteriota bacterium]